MDYQGTTAQGLITRAYRHINFAYSALPHHFSRSGRSFPAWHYFFELTRRCNLRCKMCQYIDWLNTVPVPQQRDGELDTEEWINAIDQTGPFSLMTFTGGEVWVRKDFPEILSHACSKRRVHYITNGVMLKDEKAEFCVDLAPKRFGGKGLNFVGISIDGTESIHDIVRAQNGAYKKSFEGIRNLARHREAQGKQCPLIHMNTVIMKDNLEVLPEMPAMAADVGINVLNLLTEMRSFDNPDLGYVDPATFGADQVKIPAIDRRQLEEALHKTLENATKAGVEVRLPRMPFDVLIDHYDEGYDLTHMGCRAVWTNVFVGSKGGVYTGCFLNKVGNVRENALKEIWNGPESRDFRKRRRLGAFEVCRGCCEMEYSPKALKGRLDSPDELRKKYELSMTPKDGAEAGNLTENTTA